MSKNLLPAELKEDFCGYENSYFDLWRVEYEHGCTQFYYTGKWMFKVEKQLSSQEIIFYMNFHELAYKNGYKNGVSATQSKIKSALGIR